MVRQSTVVLLYKNRTLVSRTGSDDDGGVPETLTGQYQAIGYHGVVSLVTLDENVNADNVRTLSENLLDSVENIFYNKNHPFQHDNAVVHMTHRTVTWLEQQDIYPLFNGNPSPRTVI